MTNASVMAGPCRFNTEITAEKEGRSKIKLTIKTQCPHYKALETELTEADSYAELLGKGEAKVCAMVEKYKKHATCPVALGILKAIEVEAGLALPVEPEIKIAKN